MGGPVCTPAERTGARTAELKIPGFAENCLAGRRVDRKPAQVFLVHAGEVVFVGVKHRMEIWSVEKWNEYQQRILEDFESLTDEIYE